MKTANQLFVCKKCGSIHDKSDTPESVSAKEVQCPSCGSLSKVALETSAGQELISRFQKFTADFAYLSRESDSYE